MLRSPIVLSGRQRRKVCRLIEGAWSVLAGSHRDVVLQDALPDGALTLEDLDMTGILDGDDTPGSPMLPLPELLVGSGAEGDSPTPYSPESSCGCHVAASEHPTSSRDSAHAHGGDQANGRSETTSLPAPTSQVRRVPVILRAASKNGF
jgi:hypothetical protein